MQMTGLKLHMKKCCLFQRRVNFLGHVLTKAGVEVQPEKVAAVQNWPTPQNLTELRSFVGLCSYYRRFISEFANVAATLHELTRKNARTGPSISSLEEKTYCSPYSWYAPR